MEKIIYCIGDSHVSFFSGLDGVQPCWPIVGNDVISFFRTYRLGPVLAYNLCEINTTTKGREALFSVLDTIPCGSTILLCFGEIDCRAHLLKQSVRRQKDIENVTKDCVDRYLRVILEIQTAGFSLIVWNVVPSIVKEIAHTVKFPVYGTCEERNRITALFNLYLSNLCYRFRIPFISIFDRLVDTEGLTLSEFYLKDGQHLSQKAMPLAISALNQVLGGYENKNGRYKLSD